MTELQTEVRNQLKENAYLTYSHDHEREMGYSVSSDINVWLDGYASTCTSTTTEDMKAELIEKITQGGKAAASHRLES